MNSLIIVVIAIVCFSAAYKFYGRKLELLLGVEPKRATPAYSKFDSLDYIPAKNWFVLFGHHFSSIAGAGPIVGPVIAVMLWGWLPALLWVIIGSIFIGGIHDFGSLIISVRGGGLSIGDIAGDCISRRAKVILSLFVWLALILVIAVFLYLCADTFLKDPKIVLPSLGLIPVSVVVGYLLYYLRANTVLSTLFGLVCLLGLILLGSSIAISASINSWIMVLIAYCFIASVLPVNILLQPRDYLSSFLLIIGLGLGYLSLFLFHPNISMPSYIKWSAPQGQLWPMLFVTIACGAVSGFHSLISSGTTSKQLPNERYAKRIGYGGMLMEGLVAVMAIIGTALLFKSGDDFPKALNSITPVGIFGKGYGRITDGLLGGYGQFIAIIMLNAFILTTLDTATRISRYLTEELFGLKNRYLSTALVLAASSALAFSGKWQKIWPAFGASNQLVAALALFVLSCWLISKGKPAIKALLPAFFMLVTALGALVFQAVNYLKHKDILLMVVTILLIILSVFMLYEIAPKIFSRRKQYA